MSTLHPHMEVDHAGGSLPGLPRLGKGCSCQQTIAELQWLEEHFPTIPWEQVELGGCTVLPAAQQQIITWNRDKGTKGSLSRETSEFRDGTIQRPPLPWAIGRRTRNVCLSHVSDNAHVLGICHLTEWVNCLSDLLSWEPCWPRECFILVGTGAFFTEQNRIENIYRYWYVYQILRCLLYQAKTCNQFSLWRNHNFISLSVIILSAQQPAGPFSITDISQEGKFLWELKLEIAHTLQNPTVPTEMFIYSALQVPLTAELSTLGMRKPLYRSKNLSRCIWTCRWIKWFSGVWMICSN